ncbi:MAG: hypothetical protein ACP5OA_02240 [Candidatus Woesearchaeota archaeon]
MKQGVNRMGFLGIDWFGKAAASQANTKISQLETENTTLLQQSNQKLSEIERLNSIVAQKENELKKYRSEMQILSEDNEKSKNLHAKLQLEHEKLLTHVKQIEESEERHERVLPALISADVSFNRTLVNIKSMNAECLRKLKALPEKYSFLYYETRGWHSGEQLKELEKMFYPRGGDHSIEQRNELRKRNIEERYSPHDLPKEVHFMLQRFISINRYIQELENVALEKTRNVKVMQASNEISYRILKKYSKNMEYFKSWDNTNKIDIDNDVLKIIDKDLELNKDAVKAFKDEVLSETHVESLNRSIVNIFRQILFELNFIKTKYESSVEIKNLDIFSKEMFGMFEAFKQSLEKLILTSQNELRKYSELVNKLTNEEDVALGQTLKTLGMVLKDEISQEELIIKSYTKNIN